MYKGNNKVYHQKIIKKDVKSRYKEGDSKHQALQGDTNEHNQNSYWDFATHPYLEASIASYRCLDELPFFYLITLLCLHILSLAPSPLLVSLLLLLPSSCFSLSRFPNNFRLILAPFRCNNLCWHPFPNLHHCILLNVFPIALFNTCTSHRLIPLFSTFNNK